jgi:hypothetical protein
VSGEKEGVGFMGSLITKMDKISQVELVNNRRFVLKRPKVNSYKTIKIPRIPRQFIFEAILVVVVKLRVWATELEKEPMNLLAIHSQYLDRFYQLAPNNHAESFH